MVMAVRSRFERVGLICTVLTVLAGANVGQDEILDFYIDD